MLLRIFKRTTPGVLLLMFVILTGLWFSTFLNPSINNAAYSEIDPMPLYGLLKLIFGNNHFCGVLFSFSVVTLMSFLLVRFNTNIFFLRERSYLPAVFYIFISGLFSQQQSLNPVLPASVFLMLAIIRVMDGYRKPGTAYSFFDAGIMIGIGSLFYANLIWFGILIIIGILLLRTSNMREILITLVGLLTPFLITLGFYYVLGEKTESFLLLVKDNLFMRSEPYYLKRIIIVTLIFIGTLVLMSIAYLFMLMNTKKIKSRKTFALMIWAFLISIGVYFVMPSVSVEIIWLVAIPISYFLAHYFVLVKKKLIPEILFSVLVVLILLIQIL
jgi:Family of unknown function (DUF6427)